jgi:mRNA-degrading endonuclease RelE of RelBE toxin-antitoxin system
MVDLVMSEGAIADFDSLPGPIQERVIALGRKLRRWPEVSGAKPLKHEWKGHFRVRTGDYRIIFRVQGDAITIVRIAHRRDVYED